LNKKQETTTLQTAELYTGVFNLKYTLPVNLRYYIPLTVCLCFS